jgi:hypothetical protein
MAQPVVPAQESHPTPSVTSRQDATGRDASAELTRIEELYGQLLAAYKEQAEDLRKDKTALQADKEALLAPLMTKDRQIERFFSSERDTKTLFGTLQSLVASIPRASKAANGTRRCATRSRVGCPRTSRRSASSPQPRCGAGKGTEV